MIKIMKNNKPDILRSLCNSLLIFIFFVYIMSLWGCYPSLKEAAQRPEQALIPVKNLYPKFHDDMDLGSLVKAIEMNLEYLNRLDQEYIFFYGPHKFTCRQVQESQETFLKLILSVNDPEQLNREIKKNFHIYKAAGRVGNRHILFTGYFEPVFEASLRPDERFKYPIYSMPDNLIKIDLSLFNEKFKDENIIGRIEGNNVLPYYSRKQIEVEKALNGKNLELAWLKDPLDVTFLHIQGSGRLKLPDGNIISVGYESSNGQPYRSIGSYMLDKGYMSREEMSMQGIRSYLSGHPEVIDEVLNYNPSYVFFRILDNGPLGNIDVPLTAGRSIALDSGIFPKGAICFLTCEKPVINNNGEIESWTKFSRFVMNQDTGGAIKGAGRADIFWGSDQYAELAAGHMNHEGELYILIKKP
jgi:membrane-bound lytic murein transglycosylase A